MAKVNICDVTVLDNPSPFKNPFQFEITFECLEDLKDDLEWRILYVGSAESEDYDQVLDTVLVGPLVSGRHKFVFQADAPDVGKIPVQDATGVTVVLLTCGYRNQEFIRVGYYVNNEYGDPELKENPPSNPDFDKMTRNILATCPRVTRFRIDWNDNPEQAGVSGATTSGASENAENQPPPYNTESESNQMGGVGVMELGGGGDSLKSDRDSNMMPPTGLSNGLSGAGAGEKVLLNGSTADGSNMDLGGGFAPKTATSSSDSRDEPSAMEM